jgi:WD40 repeat protein/serine/threonine protein kinase
MTESQIFKDAVKLPLEERAAYLEQACAADNVLRREVEALLRAHEDPGSFLQSHPAEPPAATREMPLAEQPGTRIGVYKLLQQIGEGGMGVVYMAEQQEPVQRKVALKIIKPGMDSKQVIARFEAERQALALMDHQNIARVFDAGATESGRPYFVMELVHGVPLTQYCDDRQLTPLQRLELFVPVCHAIQHAHQKGIIHRDLKPSNILVTMYDDRPVPKVIDFGVAKAVEQRLTEKTLFTQFGTLVGTFEYMSPEQAEMNAFGVDTRSDVYSLGVVLYELLTGSTPLERRRLHEAAYGEIVRLIKEEEPPRPSTRLSSSGAALAGISQQRGSEPEKLTKLVRGELDWIVMRCLEKDRARRYETANGLARDVERYLKDEPVEACPPTVGYKLRKFARKHRKLLFTAVAFAALLLLGAAASTWQAVRATGAETLANANAVQAQEKEREAIQERNEAQRQRDEVKALNEKLRETQEQLRRTLYMAHMSLVQHAWNAGGIERVQDLLEQHRPKPGETDLRGFEWHYFNRLCHLGRLLIKVQGDVHGLAYSPDGTRLAGGVSGDKTVKVWDARTGNELLTLKRHTRGVAHTTFNPDGTRLATASWDNTVKVWDAWTGKELLTLKGPEGAVKELDFLTGVAFSPDGKRLAAVSVDPQTGLRVWDAQTGAEMCTFKGLAGSIAFSPDGKRLAGNSSDGFVKVFDAQTGQELLALKKKEQTDPGGGNVVFSPDGTKLAAVSRTSTGGGEGLRSGGVQVWDAQTGQELFVLKGHAGTVESVAFSPDGQRLASASQDRTVKVWDARSGQELFTLKGHTSALWGLAFSPDGKHLATSGGGTVRVWDVQPLAIGEGIHGVADISVSPDGKQVATAVYSADQPGTIDVKVWDTQTGRELLAIKGLAGRTLSVRVVFSPDGKRLAAGLNSLAKVWDAQTGQELFSIEDPRLAAGAAFSPDGKTLALGGKMNAGAPAAVTLWDAQTRKELLSCKAPGHVHVSHLVFSPDGKRLFGRGSGTFSDPGGVKGWDVRTGEELLFLKAAGALALSPDGKRLAGQGLDNTVKVWDAETGRELLTLKGGHTRAASSIVFSPDGQRLVSAVTGGAGTVKVWNAQTGEELLSLNGQGPVAFSPDGRRLFGCAPDGTLKIWDATPLPEKP